MVLKLPNLSELKIPRVNSSCVLFTYYILLTFHRRKLVRVLRTGDMKFNIHPWSMGPHLAQWVSVGWDLSSQRNIYEKFARIETQRPEVLDLL
jgi:hypothetical protein